MVTSVTDSYSEEEKITEGGGRENEKNKGVIKSYYQGWGWIERKDRKLASKNIFDIKMHIYICPFFQKNSNH